MPRRLIINAALLLGLGHTAPALAEENPNAERGTLSLIYENDTFAATDRNYTNGVKLSVLSTNLRAFDSDTVPGPLRTLSRALRPLMSDDAIPKLAPKWLKYDKQVRGISLFNLLYSFYLFFINRSSSSMATSKSQLLRILMKTTESESASSTTTLMTIQSTSLRAEWKIVASLREYF
jgi:hypothetical protein